MKFRTQDKLGIVTCDNIITNDKCEILGVVDSSTSFLLGKYKTIDECKIVVDEIVKVFDDSKISFFEDNKIPVKNTNILLTVKDSESEFNFHKLDIIFQMPKHAWQLISIADLDLPVIVYNKFHKMGFETIQDVLDANFNNYHKNQYGISGLGTKSIKIMMEAINKYEKLKR